MEDEEEPEELSPKQKYILYHQNLKKLHPFNIRIQLRVPPLTMETVREYIKLPEKYCDACTLREGTILSMIILQTISALSVAFLVTLLYYYYEDTEYFWQEKFKEDFDPYLENENKAFVDALWSTWDELFLALIITEGTYFVTGLGVIYALIKKTAHPAWHLPWIILSGFLVAMIFLISFTLLIFNSVVATFRYISVTYDIVPMILTFIYSIFWYYSFVTVLAHYKRRCIVKYWRDSRKFIVGDF